MIASKAAAERWNFNLLITDYFPDLQKLFIFRDGLFFHLALSFWKTAVGLNPSTSDSHILV